MRNEDDRVEEAIKEAIQICRETNVPTQISHFKACNQNNWHKVDHMLEMIQNASNSGLPINADRYPYIAYGTGLSIFLPLWSRQGNTDEVITRLQDRELIPKIKEHVENRGNRIGGWDRVVISSCFSEQNKIWEGKSIKDCADITGKKPFDFIRNILIEERNRVDIVGFAMNEDNLKKVLSHPLVMVGSDGSAVSPKGKLSEGKPHPRYYGTFPRVLKKGYYADITIFNPETVIDNATFMNPHQFPTGLEYVIVNGKVTVENGEHTGERAGKILRHEI